MNSGNREQGRPRHSRRPCQGTGNGMAEILNRMWAAILRLHANQVGAAGDQPDDAPAGGKGGEAAAAVDDRGPLTEEGLYPPEGGGDGESDKGGKPAKKAEGGEGEGEGGQPKSAGKQDRQWDAERQQRDQEHAAERRRMEDLVQRQGEQITHLLGQLQTAAAPKKGSEADDDLRELEEAIAGVTEDADPAAIVRSQRAILAAIKKVRSSSGPSPELTALKAELEELKGASAQGAATAAARDRQERIEKFLIKQDGDPVYGPDLRNEAIRIATETVVGLGYTGENPAPEHVAMLALSVAYRDARDARAAAKAKGGGGKPKVPADSGAGGGAAGDGVPKGGLSNKGYLRRLRGK